MKTLCQRFTSPLSGPETCLIIGTSVCFCVAAVAHVTLVMLYACVLGLMIIFCPVERDKAVYFCRVLLLSVVYAVPGSAFALWIAFPEVWLKRLYVCLVGGGGFFIGALILGLSYRFFEQWWNHRFDLEHYHFHL